MKVRKIKKLISVSQEEVDRKWGKGRTKPERVKDILLDDGTIIRTVYIHPSEAEKYQPGKEWEEDLIFNEWDLPTRDEVIRKFIRTAIELNEISGCDIFDWKLPYRVEERLKKENLKAYQTIEECFHTLIEVCNQYGIVAYSPKYEVGWVADLCEICGIPQKQDWKGYWNEHRVKIWKEFIKRMGLIKGGEKNEQRR